MTLPKGFGQQPKSGAKRTYEEWWATVPEDLKSKTRKGDESNKPLLNQVNYVLTAPPSGRKTRRKAKSRRAKGLAT